MKYTGIFAAGLAVSSGYWALSIKPELETKRDFNGLDAHDSHASASLLGQFRTSLSSTLWVRTDLYLHNGVEMRPLTDAEKQSGQHGVGNGEAGQDALHDDDSIVTVVPSSEKDFRGIFGDIDRETHAYKSMTNHKHNDPENALPLFRLMTWLDPQFLPGWTTGATVMARRQTEASTRQGIRYLLEGLDQNPNSVTILAELGRFYAAKLKDFKHALPYLEKAVTQPIDPDFLSESEADGYVSAYRWAALCYKELDQPEKMHAVAMKGLQWFRDDPVLMRCAGTPPMVLSPKGEKEWLEKLLQDTGDHAHE